MRNTIFLFVFFFSSFSMFAQNEQDKLFDKEELTELLNELEFEFDKFSIDMDSIFTAMKPQLEKMEQHFLRIEDGVGEELEKRLKDLDSIDYSGLNNFFEQFEPLMEEFFEEFPSDKKETGPKSSSPSNKKTTKL